MKINEKHSPTEERHKSTTASGSRSLAVELAWSFDTPANSRWSWRRTKDTTDRTSDSCSRSSKTRHKRFRSSADTSPTSEGSEAAGPPQPQRQRTPGKNLSYLSEISNAESDPPPQPLIESPPAVQTSASQAADNVGIQTGRFWDLSQPLQRLFYVVDEIR